MSAIVVQSLTKQFDGQMAVAGIEFTVHAGELCVLLGPSGCGKSTTLRLIAGLDEPTDGHIFIGGRDVVGTLPKDRNIAMVFQSYALFPHLSVGENIIFGLKVRGVARAQRDERLRRVADMTGLTPYLSRKPGQLSGGQRQRVALARAIISEQPICLMDEPLSNLDAKLRGEMRLEIRNLQQRLGMTMIYVTHDQVEAMTMADRVILMNSGRIEQNGSPAELYEMPASAFTARFIGAPAMNILPSIPPSQPILGVRAEHLILAPSLEGSRHAIVSSLEYLGADTIVGLTTAEGASLAARVPGRASHPLGQSVSIRWSPEHEHHFDPATGLRLPSSIAPHIGT